MGKKVIFLSRSDLRGGAAIVTYRLMLAIRDLGVDARMLVCEKLSDSPYVDYCAPKWKIQYSFLKERLKVFVKNGFNRSTLFKVDPALEGLPLWNHPWVKEADGIYLGWVNQGMISLKGVRRLYKLGIPMVWVMHDMWNMTGICHHAGDCVKYKEECGDCPMLCKMGGSYDMSRIVWGEKRGLYREGGLQFVAVSSWLAAKAAESSLLRDKAVSVIPNPFAFDTKIPDDIPARDKRAKVRIIFGAARIDDPIKGLSVLRLALEELCRSHPDVADNLQLVTFGGVKDTENIKHFAIDHEHLGEVRGQDNIRRAYEGCDIVVSTSEFETLPGTLVEGQAYGCIPVAIDHGGQRDIVDHLQTGYLAAWDDNEEERARRVANGIVWAYELVGDLQFKDRMRESVIEKFGAKEVAQRMLDLI